VGPIGLGDTNLEIVKVFAFGKLLHAPVMDVWFRPGNPNLGDTATNGTAYVSNLMIRPFPWIAIPAPIVSNLS